MIKQIKLPNGETHDIGAIFDGQGNNIGNTYAKKSEITALTNEQIDAICGQSIVNASEVEF